MTLKTYIVTIEDIYRFNHTVEVVANNSYDALHALRHANYHTYGNGNDNVVIPKRLEDLHL